MKDACKLVTTIVFLMLFVSAAPAFAQGFGVGIKGGPLFADFSSDDLDFDNRTGWQGGIFFGGNRQGPVGVMTEINFIKKAVTFVIPPASGSDLLDQRFTVSYLEVPVFLRLNLGTQSKNGFAFYVIVGPSFDVKVDENLGLIDVDDAFEGVDVGVIGGAGFEVSRIIIEGRYTRGLTNISGDFASASEIRTRSFAILFGLRFN